MLFVLLKVVFVIVVAFAAAAGAVEVPAVAAVVVVVAVEAVAAEDAPLSLKLSLFLFDVGAVAHMRNLAVGRLLLGVAHDRNQPTAARMSVQATCGDCVGTL